MLHNSWCAFKCWILSGAFFFLEVQTLNWYRLSHKQLWFYASTFSLLLLDIIRVSGSCEYHELSRADSGLLVLERDLEEMTQVLKPQLTASVAPPSTPVQHLLVPCFPLLCFCPHLVLNLLCFFFPSISLPLSHPPSLFLCSWRLPLPSLVTCSEGRKPLPFLCCSTHVLAVVSDKDAGVGSVTTH